MMLDPFIYFLCFSFQDPEPLYILYLSIFLTTNIQATKKKKQPQKTTMTGIVAIIIPHHLLTHQVALTIRKSRNSHLLQHNLQGQLVSLSTQIKRPHMLMNLQFLLTILKIMQISQEFSMIPLAILRLHGVIM
jgi:hypothetical protein